MRIGAADQAELVGVHAELGFHLEAVLERRPGVLEFQHLRLLDFGEVEVALVPALEVRELIVGRQERMRLAVALDLRGFVERLPAHAVLGIFTVDPPAGEQLDDREHAAVAQIAVVREREDFGAGLFFGHRHPLPQVARIGAAERRQRRVRLDQAGFGAAVAPDDIAMKVVAAGIRGPLVADEGGETAGLVRLVRRLDRLAPGAAIGGRARSREAFRHLAATEAGDDVDGRLRAFAGIDLVIPFAALRRCQQGRIAADQLREKAHPVRVIRHHQEIERPRKLGALSAGCDRPPRPSRNDKRPSGRAARRTRPRPSRTRYACACRRSTAASGNCAPRKASKAASRETPSRPSPCRACRYRWSHLVRSATVVKRVAAKPLASTARESAKKRSIRTSLSPRCPRLPPRSGWKPGYSAQPVAREPHQTPT